MSATSPSMEDLPEHVMVEILSRLAVKTIIQCKCVCKKWLDLVSDSYFERLHLSRSSAGIMIKGFDKPGILEWVEVVDEIDHHCLHHDPVMNFDLNLAPIFQNSDMVLMGSVDGLLCLWQFHPKSCNTYICNPITREYMTLPRNDYKEGDPNNSYGFGVASLTKEYKVIQISQCCHQLIKAEVYTLGTGQWTSLGHLPYRFSEYKGPFLNGHAHWTIDDKDSPEKLYAFDFDNETFNLFPSPPVETIQGSRQFTSLSVLKGCLCQSYATISSFTLWVMKEYGIKKSWHKEVIIKESICADLLLVPMYLIEHLRDGTTLILCSEHKLLAYSFEKGTVADTGYFDSSWLTGMAFCPSFLKLRNFKTERVDVF